MAVGRRGVNVRLAGDLLDLDINIITLDENGNPIPKEEQEAARAKAIEAKEADTKAEDSTEPEKA